MDPNRTRHKFEEPNVGEPQVFRTASPGNVQYRTKVRGRCRRAFGTARKARDLALWWPMRKVGAGAYLPPNDGSPCRLAPTGRAFRQ